MILEGVVEVVEVDQGAGEPVQAGHQHQIQLARLRIRDQSLDLGTIQRLARLPLLTVDPAYLVGTSACLSSGLRRWFQRRRRIKFIIMGYLLRPIAGGVSSFQMVCAERRRQRRVSRVASPQDSMSVGCPGKSCYTGFLVGMW